MSLTTSNLGPVDYEVSTVPEGYRCGACGAHGGKLWREYQTFLEHQRLWCVDCAGTNQEKSVEDVDAEGRRSDETSRSRTDQIGWLVPAVPTEDGDTYWGYSSVPASGCAWWRALPTRTGDAVSASFVEKRDPKLTGPQWTLLAAAAESPGGEVALEGSGRYASARRLFDAGLVRYAGERRGGAAVAVVTDAGRALVDARRCAECDHLDYHCLASGCNHFTTPLVGDLGDGFYCDCEAFVAKKAAP